MKYRIIERTNFSGDAIFVPQYKKFFFWFDFWSFDFPPSGIKYHSLESATKFIKKQISKPKEKIYYIEND